MPDMYNHFHSNTTANRDPIANIMGPAYAGSVDLVQVHSQLTRDRDSAGKNKEGDEAAFRLLLLLHSMDIKLMKNSVQQLAKYARDDGSIGV